MAESKTTGKRAGARKAAPKKATAKASVKPAAAKPAARKPAAKKPAAKKPAAAKAAAGKKTAAKGKPRVKAPPAQRRSKRTSAARSKGEAARDVALFDSLSTLRSIFAEHLVLTVERLQDALDEAVRHGRIMPTDAQELGGRIAQAGRKQLDDLLAEVDKLRTAKK